VGYVEQSLISGERVTHRAELHWSVFFSLKALLTLFIHPLIERATSEFAVTNRRVIIKVGLISRRTVELKLEKIESIGVDQTILGRILGYGTITVRGTGGTNEPFRGLARPLEFRKAVNEASEAHAREARVA
jgi:uncharacterized membrane protein YdbT with pleckstrin-like domain